MDEKLEALWKVQEAMRKVLLQQAVEDFIQRISEVPPPWAELPDTHPCDIGWRMGGGEWHIMVWGHWWDAQNFPHQERVEYFRRWPPPPCWLEWVADTLWDLTPWDTPDEFDYSPYFVQLELLGFGTRADFEQDFNDPKWFDQQ